MTIQRAGRGPAFILLASLAASLSLSCGSTSVQYPETGATLEGTVKYGSEPVPFALIIAVGQDSATGKVDSDGRYTITNCPLGEVKLAVNTEAGKGDYMTVVMSASQPGPDGKGQKVNLPKFVDVPKKYHDPETSGLRTTVNKGSNTFDIVIPK